MAKSSWDWNAFRLAVIEAGIRGELTADWRAANPDVEPAHVLLERIAEEKAELISTKQIRKEKPLPPISLAEVPFDIPSSWEWVRLGDVAQIIAGFSFKKPEYQSSGIRVIRISDFTREGFTNDSVVRYKYSEHLERYRVCQGDILVPMTGSVGKNYRVGELPEVDCFLNQRIAIIRSIKTSTQFIDTVMASSATVAMHRGQMKSTNGNISLSDVRETLIPLPNSKEQQEIVRILSALDSGESDGPVHPVVARIQKLEKEFRALADEYGSQEKWLADLRSALLQEAISGQLTADWRAAKPDVEPAHVLLERIAEEKAELIRTKQIRKEKPLPPISPDEVPFEIPSTWEWTRVGELGQTSTGRTPPKSEPSLWAESGVPFIQPGNISDGQISGETLFVSPAGEDETTIVGRGSVLMVCIASIGKVGVPSDDVAFNQQINSLEPVKGEPWFIANVWMSAFFQDSCWRLSSSSVTPILNKGNWRTLLIPFPPESEQLEIVRRLEAQLEKVEALQEELGRSKEAAQLLMKSKLAEVFGPAMAD